MPLDVDALAATLSSNGADTRATIRRTKPAEGLDTLPRFTVASTATGAETTADLRLESLLGRGGMGEVWLARQHSLRRAVAVKVPRSAPVDTPTSRTTTAAEALITEARVAGGLEHPHIVPIQDRKSVV
jgi:serine/threonine protein kinase